MSRTRLIAMFALGAALRFGLIGVNGYPGDIATFERWMRALATAGPSLFYLDRSDVLYPPVDYVPAYPLLLWALGALYVHLFGPIVPLSGFALQAFEKLPAILADLVLAALVYRSALRVVAPRLAGLACAAVLFAPAFWLVSALWGQIDSIAAALLLAAMYCALSDRAAAAWIVLACALLVKPQPLAVVPVFFVWQARRPQWPRELAVAALVSAAIAYAVALPFAPAKRPDAVLAWLFSRYLFGYDKYPWTSLNAWNLYAIGPMRLSDAHRLLGLPLRAWGTLLTATVVIAVCLRLRQALSASAGRVVRERWFWLASTVALAAPYMLATRMHERYLLFALGPGCVVATFGWELAAVVAGLTALFAANCGWAMLSLPTGMHHTWIRPLLHGLPLLEVVLYGLLLVIFFSGRGWSTAPLARRPTEPDAERRASQAATA